MNYSRQREMMLSYLRSVDTHPTANDIYIEMRKQDPKISLGTVYRNLSLLAENGLITRIDTDDDSVHYDGCTEPHYHFVCNECGRVYDLNLDFLDLDDEVEKQLDCSVSGHSLIYNGICSNCKDI